MTNTREKVGLPARVFLFTVDQIALMTSISEKDILDRYLYFEGRSMGLRERHLMVARNVAGPEDKPDWRVAEKEFIRWMKMRGFRFYDRGAFRS